MLQFQFLPITLDLMSKSDRYHRSGAPDSNFMIIGVPNVGKSSLINLIRTRALRVKGGLRVGASPGVTRALETKIKVSSDPLVYLLDTPGIMMPKINDLHTGMKLACCGKRMQLPLHSVQCSEPFLSSSLSYTV